MEIANSFQPVARRIVLVTGIFYDSASAEVARIRAMAAGFGACGVAACCVFRSKEHGGGWMIVASAGEETTHRREELCKVLDEILSAKETIGVLTTTRNVDTAGACIAMASKYGRPVAIDVTEYGPYLAAVDLFVSLFSFKNIKLAVARLWHSLFTFPGLLRKVDLLIVIGEALAKKYHFCKNIYIFPAVLSGESPAIGRGSGSKEPRQAPREAYVFYSGSAVFTKDELWTVIRALKIYKKEKGAELPLILSGGLRKYERVMLNLLLTRYDLHASIRHVGVVDQEIYEEYVNHAAMLVIPRSSAYGNRFNQPNRLPEYVATGRPVIVSDSVALDARIECLGLHRYKTGNSYSLFKVMEALRATPGNASQDTAARRERLDLGPNTHCRTVLKHMCGDSLVV